MTEWNKHKTTLRVNENETKALMQLEDDQVQPNYIKSDELEQEFAALSQSTQDDDDEEWFYYNI